MRGGIDQGFCLSYWRLSYRRKLIRTAWMVPWAIAAVLAVFAMDSDPNRTRSWLYVIAVMVLLLAQGAYNYRKWKSEERRDQDG